jgi:hypothetical protein
MEKLKELEQICLPDTRSALFVIINRETGQRRDYRIEDLHEQVRSIELHDVVPEDIRSQFNVARNLSLYTWFCYSFHNVSSLKAYSTVEMALRMRLGKPDKAKASLWRMMEEAVNKGFINDGRFGQPAEQSADPQSMSFVEGLPKAIAYLRNLDAHGSTALGPWSLTTLSLCADIINQLFGQNESGL